MAKVYIKEVFTKYRVLNKIILDRDTKFIAEQGVKTVVLIAYYL